MSAIRVYPVRDQLVFGKDGKLEGEQLSQSVERGETKRGGGGGEYEPCYQLRIECSGGSGVTDGHDLWEEVEGVDRVEHVHKHYPCREKVWKVGEGECRTRRLVVEPERPGSRGALALGRC